jgi:hypothetical protein
MEKLMELDKERNTLAMEMEDLKGKTKVIIDEMKIELNEFEFISRVFLEDGKAMYEVKDQIEEYKEFVRGELKKKAESNEA